MLDFMVWGELLVLFGIGIVNDWLVEDEQLIFFNSSVSVVHITIPFQLLTNLLGKEFTKICLSFGLLEDVLPVVHSNRITQINCIFFVVFADALCIYFGLQTHQQIRNLTELLLLHQT